MNKLKYKDVLYEVREISNLKEMMNSSAELYSTRRAYLIKNRPGGEYEPIFYAQVKKDVEALGTELLRLGLKGEKIAVIGENSYLWIVTYLAVVNGVGVIVPLDRELPAAEVANLIKRANVSGVVYSEKYEGMIMKLLPRLENIKYTISMSYDREERSLSLPRLMEEGREAIAKGDRSFIDAEIDDDAMCSMLFTSGTTGMAKGVMLSHRNIAANVHNMSKYVKVTGEDVGLSVLPMHHSYEMTCHIFTGFYQGICVAICEGLKYIQKNMAEAQATVMLGVPLVFESMHKKIWKQAETSGRAVKMRAMIALSRKLKLYNNTGLIRKIFKEVHEITGGHIQLFIAGGAAINPKVVEDFEAMGFPMIQGYGMTENAPIIAVNKDCCSKADSVGPVMPGTEVKIIEPDDRGRGEIICRGPSVMLGYYDNQQETEHVLVDGWLHTGDYGYFDEDGYLYITGRKKNVIVTKNGKNIFPEEVEFYLTTSKYIEEALVHGITDQKSGDAIVKAEVFPNLDLIYSEKGQLSEEELKQFLKELIDEINAQMPLYKRIKRFSVRKTEFEKTTTRKIKRHTTSNLNENERESNNAD